MVKLHHRSYLSSKTQLLHFHLLQWRRKRNHWSTLLQRNRTGTSEEMSRRSLKGGLKRQCINSWRSMRKNVRRQKLMKRQQKVKRLDDDMKEAAEHYYSIFV